MFSSLAAVQDSYHSYHHSFFLNPDGAWCVVQQGMSDLSGMARQYHWQGESVRDFLCEPHHAFDNLEADSASEQERLPISANPALEESNDLPLLNMVAWEASDNGSLVASSQLDPAVSQCVARLAQQVNNHRGR